VTALTETLSRFWQGKLRSKDEAPQIAVNMTKSSQLLLGF
jgi:hypothetical protein